MAAAHVPRVSPLVFSFVAALASALAAAPSARAATNGELRASMASLPPAGTISLSVAGPVDWVKWGFPLPADPGARGPFAALSGDVSLVATRKNSKSHLIQPLASGSLPDFVGTATHRVIAPLPPPPRLWQFGEGDGDAAFVWTNGEYPLVPGATLKSGVQLLPSADGANFNWGFSFAVDSSTTLRQLDLYLACEATPGTLTVTLGELQAPLPLSICDGPAAQEKYTIIFAAPDADYPRLLIGVYVNDPQSNPTPGPITLLAAALHDFETPDAGAIDGGVHALAGGPTLSPRALACAAVPDAAAPRRPLSLLPSLLAAALLVARRRRAPHRVINRGA